MRAIRIASRGVAAVLLGSCLAVAPLSARAQDPAPEGGRASTLVSIGAGFGTIVYAPVKLAYALTGSVLSGMAWVWTAGNSGVARSIFHAATLGDYVILAEHVQGRRSLEFVGSRDRRARRARRR